MRKIPLKFHRFLSVAQAGIKVKTNPELPAPASLPNFIEFASENSSDLGKEVM